MNSIGSILTTVAEAPKKSRSARPVSSRVWPPSEPKPYLVRLCIEIVGEIEVMASTPEQAYRLAEARAGEAKRIYKTAPHGYLACVRRPVDPRDLAKGWKWVQLEQSRDEAGNLVWVLGKDDPR